MLNEKKAQKAAQAVLMFSLSGCAPYVGYTHLSDPNVSNDGYDLVCAGLEVNQGLEYSLGACKNLASHGGELIKADVRYVWR